MSEECITEVHLRFTCLCGHNGVVSQPREFVKGTVRSARARAEASSDRDKVTKRIANTYKRLSFCREQRVTAGLSYAAMGLATQSLMRKPLRLIPMPVLYGIFMYMGK